MQPTFSPTPPAFDGDEEDGTHAPWGERDGSSTATAGWGRKRSAGDNGGDGEGMWEDSSEEDEEYRRARRLLARVGKKKSRK